MSQQTNSDSAKSIDVSTGRLPEPDVGGPRGPRNSVLPTVLPSALARIPGPSPRQNVSPAAVAANTMSGGFSPSTRISAQCRATAIATVPAATPRSGTRSRRVTLARDRRRDGVSSRAIQHPGALADGAVALAANSFRKRMRRLNYDRRFGGLMQAEP